MKFTISWLKEYLDTEKSDQELIDSLTNIGLEVEDVVNASEIFSNFIAAQVVEEKKHPNADKLKVCKVDIGSDIVDVVCGAPNVEENMKVVYAPPGSTIPSTQMKLKASKIRGVESLGMMCSEFELGISDDHDGIIKLDNNVKVGQPYAEIAGLNDTMIEIGITPNRQDCLGVSGIARDLSAAGLGTLNKRNIKNNKGKLKSPIQIDIVDNHACPAFAGRYIKNVKNIESPDWLKNKLKSIGLRPISALVDITNFVMFDMNRPLHVYDADKIDKEIIVRDSKEGEEFEALDDKKYKLKRGMCVIADKSSVLGLGGIIGGTKTSTEFETKNILLESAYFKPKSIRSTSKILNLDTDAKYRFERGIDPNSIEEGLIKAAELIENICGGTISKINITKKEKSNNTLKGDLIRSVFATSTMGVSYKVKLGKSI